MRRTLVMLALCACHAHVALAATEPVAKADPAKGQSIASQVCAACHGVDGNSAIPNNPKLAGQVAEYLQKQIANFKAAAGKKAERENPVMAGMVASLSVEDARNVAAYYAGQRAGSGVSKGEATLALGRRIWRGGDAPKGLPACAACHGAAGTGLPAQYPRLAGQHPEYTEAQLKAFRSGERRNDAGGAMQSIAAKMSDAEIRAAADYVAGLR